MLIGGALLLSSPWQPSEHPAAGSLLGGGRSEPMPPTSLRQATAHASRGRPQVMRMVPDYMRRRERGCAIAGHGAPGPLVIDVAWTTKQAALAQQDRVALDGN